MSAPLVAVAADKYAVGEGESCWLWTPDRRTPLPYEIVEVEAAMRTVFAMDAHLVTYVVHQTNGLPLRRQPRLVKAELALVRDRGFLVLHHVRMADVDRPNHAHMTADSEAEARRRLEGSPYAWHPTRAGLRIFQRLTEPVTPETYEHHGTPWLVELQRLLGGSWVVDLGARDWTRHFRLPNVRRDGVDVRASVTGVGMWRSISLSPFTPPPPEPPAPKWSSLPAGSDRVARARCYAARVAVPQCGSGQCEATVWSVALNITAGFDLDEAAALDIVESWARPSKHRWTVKRFVRAVRDAARARLGRGWLVEDEHEERRQGRRQHREPRAGGGIAIDDDD